MNPTDPSQQGTPAQSPLRSKNRAFATDFQRGPLAQRLEQGTHNPLVRGSNPRGPTIFLMSSVYIGSPAKNGDFFMYYPHEAITRKR